MKIIIPILAFFVFSCSFSAKEKEKEKTKLNLNVAYELITIDPRKGSDFVSSSIQFLLYDGLTRMTPYSKASMSLAEQIDVSDDGLKYTFHLRNAKWSNGAPITAFDFVQTWKDILDPNFPCPNAHLLYPIKNAEKAKKGLISEKQIGIRALDHKTLEVYLEYPTPFFLEMISFAVFFPINQSVALRNAKWADCTHEPLVSSGPYCLKKWKEGDEMVLEKNPHYWDKDNVKLDTIHISFINNELTALKLYERDELDILGLPFTGIPSDSVPTLLDKGQIKTSSLPASTICCFNLSSFPFTNLNIRKAFAYAINRQEIVDNITRNSGSIGLHLIPDCLREEKLPPFFKDGDIEMAKMCLQKGLKELGVTEESLGEITLLHATTGVYPKIAQALQEQWRKALGVHVSLVGNEYKIFIDQLTHKNFQMAQCVWIAQYQDPLNFFERFKSKTNPKNYCGYENREYIEIIEESLLEKDPIRRNKLLLEAEKIFVNDMPLTAIYHWNNLYLQKPYVENLLIYPSGSFHLDAISLTNKKAFISNLSSHHE